MTLKQGKPVQIIKRGPESGLPLGIYAWADHRASPVEVAESLNSLLSNFGLQIVQHENETDEYSFTIAAL